MNNFYAQPTMQQPAMQPMHQPQIQPMQSFVRQDQYVPRTFQPINRPVQPTWFNQLQEQSKDPKDSVAIDANGSFVTVERNAAGQYVQIKTNPTQQNAQQIQFYSDPNQGRSTQNGTHISISNGDKGYPFQSQPMHENPTQGIQQASQQPAQSFMPIQSAMPIQSSGQPMQQPMQQPIQQPMMQPIQPLQPYQMLHPMQTIHPLTMPQNQHFRPTNHGQVYPMLGNYGYYMPQQYMHYPSVQHNYRPEPTYEPSYPAQRRRGYAAAFMEKEKYPKDRRTRQQSQKQSLSTSERYKLYKNNSSSTCTEDSSDAPERQYEFEPYSYREWLTLKSRDGSMKLPASLGPNEDEDWKKKVTIYVNEQKKIERMQDYGNKVAPRSRAASRHRCATEDGRKRSYSIVPS